MAQHPTIDPTHPFFEANWLWPAPWADLINAYALFHRAFKLTKCPSRAVLSITADQHYVLYVNGRYVCRGPARGYQSHWPFDQVDLTGHLQAGENWISVRVHTPGIGTFSYRHERCAGLILALDCDETRLTTDRNWSCRIDPSRLRHTQILSLQLGMQEHVDLRCADDAWIVSPDRPEGFHAPAMVQPAGSPPWHSFEPRALPMLSNERQGYATAVAKTAVSASCRLSSTLNPTVPFFDLLRPASWEPCAPDESTRAGEWLEVTLPAVAPGKLQASTVDFGRPVVGTTFLEIEACEAGQVCDLTFVEAIDEDRRPMMCDPRQGNPIAMSSRMLMHEGLNRHESFPIIGHRFVSIAREGPAVMQTLRIGIRECIYPLEIQGGFRCNDAVINDIYRISVATQRVCMLDAYVDTPWREQGQWWGDARIQAKNTFYLANDPRLLARGIRQIADPEQELPNGLSCALAPTIAHACVLPDFCLVWMLTLWDHYLQTGDVSLFVEQWPRARRMLEYFGANGESRNASGLLRYDPRYWLFFDWTDDLPRRGMPTLLSLLYLMALDRLIALAQIASMPDVVASLSKELSQYRSRVDECFWDSEAGLFRDGLEADGSPINRHCVQNQAVAMLTDLWPDRHEQLARRSLRPYLEGASVPGSPSPYGLAYVYYAARASGLSALAVEHLRRHWEPMIPFGGTWEMFVSETVKIGNASTTHAWSAHPIHLFPILLLGLEQTAPAWASVRIEPCLAVNSVDEATATVPTPNGLIEATWRRVDSHRAKLSLSLPDGVTACVAIAPGVNTLVTGCFEGIVVTQG